MLNESDVKNVKVEGAEEEDVVIERGEVSVILRIMDGINFGFGFAIGFTIWAVVVTLFIMAVFGGFLNVIGRVMRGM